MGTKGIPHLVTHDARTIRYPDPLIKVNDTIQIDLESGKITEFIKFDTGKQPLPPRPSLSSPDIRAVVFSLFSLLSFVHQNLIECWDLHRLWFCVFEPLPHT